MATIFGRFFFKLTDSKNLIGEFSNNFSKSNSTESADRMVPDVVDGKFVGEYYSTWHEVRGGRHVCVLTQLHIKLKAPNIFSLNWWDLSSGKLAAKPFYCGEGMLCDGILIGNYEDC